jgi:uncharacterized protein
MKKCLVLFVIIALALPMLCIGARAENERVRLFDNGDFLSEANEKALTSKMNALSDSHNIDVIILLDKGLFDDDLSSFELDSSMLSYCKGFFSKHSATGNGVMLMISLDCQYRDYYFFSKGDCEKKINTDRSLDLIEDSSRPFIERNDFYNASIKFLEAVDARMSAPPPAVTDYILEYLPITFIVALIIALVAVLIMKAQLSSVRPKAHAGDYSVHSSFNVRLSRDIFLYRTVRKTPKPKNTSSGGGSRGGGGGGGGGGGRGGRC